MPVAHFPAAFLRRNSDSFGRPRLWRAVLFGMGALASVPAAHAQIFSAIDVLPLGLTGAGYTQSSTGRQAGGLYGDRAAVNSAGQVIGYSLRYDGDATKGSSAWLHSQGVTTALGYSDGVHVSASGAMYSDAKALNAAGQVIGTSARLLGETQTGTTAWISDGRTTTRIGLWDAAHVRADGSQSSAPLVLNAAGAVAGTSSNLSGGSSAWRFDGTSTTRIGLLDAAHTLANGMQSSSVVAMNSAGTVLGTALNGEGAGGSSAWLYDGTQTRRIGLLDGSNLSQDGTRSSAAVAINDAGYAIGSSSRYIDGRRAGSSAWISNGTSTTEIGLAGAPLHTSISGDQSSTPLKINAGGQVVGTAFRYSNSGGGIGTSAWFYDGHTTTQIGLVDGHVVGHTSATGIQVNTVRDLNDRGQAVGTADQYIIGKPGSGRDAWFFDGHTTQQIGLTGGLHANAEGYRFNSIVDLNEAGQVIGTARIYTGLKGPDGSSITGQSGWFFDPATGQTQDLTFSMRLGDGYAYTTLNFLGEDGLVLGSYEKFDGVNNLGTYAFAWTAGSGLSDLGTLTSGGLSASGWSSLSTAVQASADGRYIVGMGTRIDGVSTSVFLASAAAVPEPAEWALMMAGLGVVGAAWVRRRRIVHQCEQ